MKKTVWIIMSVLFVLSAVSFAACAPDEARSSYAITAEYFPEERRLDAIMEVDIVNTSDTAWETLKFQLYPNAYREGAKYPPVSALYESIAYYDGKSYGGIRVDKVEGAQAFRVAGEDETILQTDLAAPLYPDERVQLTMHFTVSLAKIAHRLGVGRNAVNLAEFYPILCNYNNGFCEYVYTHCGDPIVSACADYSVTLTVPQSYLAAHTGQGVRTLRNGKAEYHVRAENVREFAMVLSDKFQMLETQVGDVPVCYYYYNDNAAQQTMELAAESIAFFGEQFGAYAYPCYTLVQTDGNMGGVEFPMLSMLSADLAGADMASVVVHETAHQWWYAAVGSDQVNDAWQDEGLAEWSTALFYEAHPAFGMTYADWMRSYMQSYRVRLAALEAAGTEVDLSMRRPLTSFKNEYEMRVIVYNRGAIMFDGLKTAMGQERLLSALRTYYRAYAGKIATAEQLMACLIKESSLAEGVVDSFLSGKAVI